MNNPAIHAKAKRRRIYRRVVWGGATAIVLTAVVAVLLAADGADRGDDPYTPTKGEWLCLTLNVEETIAAAYWLKVKFRVLED